MKKINIILLFITILFANACGYHLRKEFAVLDIEYPAIYLPATGSHTLHQNLYRALVASKVKVIDEKPEGMQVPQLLITGERLTSQPMVYGADGELRRERMKKTVAYSFITDKTVTRELSTERERQLNSRQHLGDNAEKILLEREMEADIIQQMLRLLANP